MAHQWFGDMVTMQWWDNLWLNEGFATWMETKPVAEWKPEWNFPQDDAQDLDQTLNLDAQKTTRTIRATANTPDEINEMFDGIAYGKAGAVIGMVENYLGKEVFRQGVHNYLQAHLYANATAEDFWNAQTANSHLPVDKIMSSFVTQPGVPLLTFSERQASGVPVAQSRFFLSATANPAGKDQRWTVPVCLKTSGQPICRVLTPEDSSIPLPMDVGLPMLYANAGGKGYYRTALHAEAVQRDRGEGRDCADAAGEDWVAGRSLGAGAVGAGKCGGLSRSGSGAEAGLRTLRCSIRRINRLRRSTRTSPPMRTAPSLPRCCDVSLGRCMPALGSPVKKESRLTGSSFAAPCSRCLGAARDPAVLAEAQQLTARAFAVENKKDKTLDADALGRGRAGEREQRRCCAV